MFNSKYKKALKEIDSEIAQYEAEMKTYDDMWENLRKNDPNNIKGIDAAFYMYEQNRNRRYGLMRLRDKLTHDIG
jgi:hypothetical protein